MNESEIIQDCIKKVCEKMGLELNNDVFVAAERVRPNELPFAVYYVNNYRPTVSKKKQLEVVEDYIKLMGLNKTPEMYKALISRIKGS